MGGHIAAWLNPGCRTVELLLAAPVVLWAGKPLLIRGWESVKTRNPNMWTLIGAGTSVAFLYSLAATIVPGWFPEVFVRDGHVPVYYEAAAIIISPEPARAGPGIEGQVPHGGSHQVADEPGLHGAPHAPTAWRATFP